MRRDLHEEWARNMSLLTILQTIFTVLLLVLVVWVVLRGC